MRAPGATSFPLVKPEEGTTSGELRGRLEILPGTEVLLKSAVIGNDLELFGSFSAPLRLMSTIASLVGVLVVGLVIYTATVERRKEYGALKAIGAKNRMLYGVVTVQALVAAGLGSALGVGLAFGAARLIWRCARSSWSSSKPETSSGPCSRGCSWRFRRRSSPRAPSPGSPRRKSSGGKEPVLRLAFRNLFQNKVRLVVSAGGIALALMLILALDAVLAGAERQITAYIDNSKADVWVSQSGVENLHMVTSSILASVTGEVEKTRGSSRRRQSCT